VLLDMTPSRVWVFDDHLRPADAAEHHPGGVIAAAIAPMFAALTPWG
jgi:hypothetical protein